MNHHHFMHRCLFLASRGRQQVGNGAMVGAVLVREGSILAEGYHHAFGQSHAERNLLEHYTGDIQESDILYINLEPCCHAGKTPPCTDIILERNIQNVVIGMVDPDSRVAGEGIQVLRNRGVHVMGPILRSECERLNRGFISVRTQNRPYITFKSARMRDGRIANEDGSPLRITNQQQDTWSHQNLRSKHDAILVGVQTVINDNPSLTIRYGDHQNYQPWRIVLDPSLRIPRTAKLLNDNHHRSTIIIYDPSRVGESEPVEIESKGVLCIPVHTNNHGFIWRDLWQALLEPREQFNGLTSILVEGGKEVWRRFSEAKVVDEEVRLVGRCLKKVPLK